MDCDQVFAVLTRAPFPTGVPQVDQPVERHLASCRGCSRLANALRPAPDLFHEALTPVQCRQLPGYWGETTPPALALAELSSHRHQHSLVKQRAFGGQGSAARVVQPTPRRASRLSAGGGPRRVVTPGRIAEWQDTALVLLAGAAITLGVSGLGWALL